MRRNRKNTRANPTADSFGSMKNSMQMKQLSSCCCALLLLMAHASNVERTAMSAEWPTYGRDARRSNATTEELKFPLKLAWQYVPAQRPRPAWPEPVKNLNRLDFDYAPQVAVAGGLLFFGSSADDTVRAIDVATGKARWRFITGGPVRFAPHVAGDCVYFASDDGIVCCLNASTGKRNWVFHAAPHSEQILGNGRMISRWPIRTGVLVDEGVVYCAAGMWAAEGVFVYALDASTGHVIWCNDTSGVMPLMGAHATFSLTGVNPQGNLLAAGNVLLVPTGRTGPAAYDRRTGKFLYYGAGHKNNGFGGSWLTIDDDRFYAFSKSFYSPLAMRAASLADGEFIPDVRHKLPQHSTFFPKKRYSLYEGRTSVVVRGGKVYARNSYGLIKAGDALIVGNDGNVCAESVDAKQLWRANVNGQARGLAVADGRLYVSTDQGEISCFASERAIDGAATSNKTPSQPNAIRARDALLLKQLKARGMDRGYAVVLGDVDGQLSKSIAAETKLHVINVLHDQSILASLRNSLLNTTRWYGSRIHVQFIEPQSPLPVGPYFANAVIILGEKPQIAMPELYRVLRPCGGVMLLPEMKTVGAKPLFTEAKIPQEEVGSGEYPRVVRGQLPGALDWDSTDRTDRRVKWPLRPIWFGGPGPAKMHSRKYRNPTLAFANGRYFVMGEGHLLAVDAYNGTELWNKPIPALKALNADADHVYLTLAQSCVLLDARNGQEAKRYKGDAVDQVPAKFRQWPRPIVDQAVTSAPRTHPLTDRAMPKVWLKAFGCSGISSSATSIFTRSGSLGTYDFADDSGMRNFGGLRPSCGQSTIAGLGLWIVNEGSSSCECSYSYQTSLAFASNQRRLNEDWAVFYDWDVDSIVRRAAVNLGAPGDRRDDHRKLWIGFPRPYTTERFLPNRPGNRSWLNIPGVPQQKMPVALQVPLAIELFDGGGTYRVNADRVAIDNTQRPWIYTSGYQGIRKATMELDFQRQLATLLLKTPPTLDAQLDDGEWGQEPTIILPNTETRVFLRHDADHLYVASIRPPYVDRRGQVSKWKKTMDKRDSQVYRDDSWEVFLSDDMANRVVHLGLSASGAQYDALCEGKMRENIRWNTDWRSAVTADDRGFITETAVPWRALNDAGLDKPRLNINFQINRQYNLGEALMYLGFAGRDRCENFAPLGIGKVRESPARKYTVRLHFAELNNVRPGDRVFDVVIQGQRKLKAFDIAAAGKLRSAVVREFKDVLANDALAIEFIPQVRDPDSTLLPAMSAIELMEQHD